MDRRYKEAKGASKAGQQRQEKITNRTLQRNRVAAHGAMQYGGSTGGAKSIAGKGSSMPILQNKNAEALERTQTFRENQMGSEFKKDFKR